MNSSSTSDSGTSRVGEGGAQRGEEIGALELARADVERQPPRDAVALPVGQHRRDFGDHPVADLGDDPGRFGDRDEAVGLAQAVARVVPAQQRLGAGDLAGDEAQLRLEREHELAALDRLAQRHLGVDLGLVLVGELGRRTGNTGSPPRLLGAIHGDVGGAHQRFDAGAMVGRERDPDRGADVDAVAVKLERLGDRQRDPPRDPLGILGDWRCAGRRR